MQTQSEAKPCLSSKCKQPRLLSYWCRAHALAKLGTRAVADRELELEAQAKALAPAA